jgi:hypothetical protein
VAVANGMRITFAIAAVLIVVALTLSSAHRSSTCIVATVSCPDAVTSKR